MDARPGEKGLETAGVERGCDMKRNPRALNGAPMGVTVCECLHAYVQHVERMPSPPTERRCLVEGCGCAQFAVATDERVADVVPLGREQVEAEYVRLNATHMLPHAWSSAGGA